jgi:hypothetical protein
LTTTTEVNSNGSKNLFLHPNSQFYFIFQKKQDT